MAEPLIKWQASTTWINQEPTTRHDGTYVEKETKKHLHMHCGYRIFESDGIFKLVMAEVVPKPEETIGTYSTLEHAKAAAEFHLRTGAKQE